MRLKTAGIVRLFRKNKKLDAIIIVLVLVILAGSVFVIRQQNLQFKDNYNRQVKGLTIASTEYLVNIYDLYYSSPTIKFKSLIDDYLGKNTILQKFQIVDTAGKIVFDSSDYEKEIKTTGSLSSSYLDYSRKSEPTYLQKNGQIETVISPYIEDWGSHKYTVVYTPDFTETNRYMMEFNIAAALIALLLVIVVVTSVSVFITIEQNILHRIEKKKLEKLDKQRTEFLLLASHNLRTPLTLVTGYISMLTEMKVTKEQLKLLVQAGVATEKLGEIVDNILAIASVQDESINKSSKLEELTILDVISEILEKNTELAAKNNLKININVEPKDLKIVTNKNYLLKALTALITNAMKFNKPNGRVDVTVGSNTKTVHITIADTGIGIKETEQRNIYTIFHRSSSDDPLVYDYDGVGVGLYMSKLLIEYLGGNIWFESALNKGTTFHLDLPILEAPKQ